MRSQCLKVIAAVTALFTATAVAAATAYVPNEGSASISVIDTLTDKVTATLRLGKKPRGIAIAKDGSRMYLSDQTGKVIIVVHLPDGKTIATVALGESPEAIYLSPDGKWLSAAVEEDDEVALIDTATLKVTRKIKTKGENPEHAVFSPDGRWLYVSAEDGDTIDVISLAQNAVVKSVKVGARPRGIGFSPMASASLCRRGERGSVQRHRHCNARSGGAIQGRQSHQRNQRASGRPACLRELRGKGSVQVIDTATNTIVREIKRAAGLEYGADADGKKPTSRAVVRTASQ